MERDGATATGRAETLSGEIRRRLGPLPSLPDPPLVSVVVPNRNGSPHLRRLLRGLNELTEYPALELVFVDNGSDDDSLSFLRAAASPWPLEIVANPHNESFSDACNQGAGVATGELLLFLNNDAEPFEAGWLAELVAALDREGRGLVGPTLLNPAAGSEWGYLVQQRAVLLRDRDGELGPDRDGFRNEPFGEGFGETLHSPVPAGACMLVERDLFAEVGGFTHGYLYGGEDIDLAMKVLDSGRSVLCSGRSHLIHRLGSTRAGDDEEHQHARSRGNRRLLTERWGARLRREFELDRLAGDGVWAAPGEHPTPGSPTREQALALAFCLKSSEPAPADGDDPLAALQAELASRNHRSTVLREERIGDLAGCEYDVAVHLRGPARYAPNPAQLNVLWTPEQPESVPELERRRYSLIWSEDEPAPLLGAILAHAERIDFPTRLGPAGNRSLS